MKIPVWLTSYVACMIILLILIFALCLDIDVYIRRNIPDNQPITIELPSFSSRVYTDCALDDYKELMDKATRIKLQKRCIEERFDLK